MALEEMCPAPSETNSAGLTSRPVSRYLCHMARGPSGRIVVYLDPALKREFHAALAADNTTLKEWLLARVCAYFEERQQPRLVGLSYSAPEPEETALAAEQQAIYKVHKPKS